MQSHRPVICSLLGRQLKNKTVYLEGGIFAIIYLRRPREAFRLQ